jgi:ActR/RegA family two-component response regulator
LRPQGTELLTWRRNDRAELREFAGRFGLDPTRLEFVLRHLHGMHRIRRRGHRLRRVFHEAPRIRRRRATAPLVALLIPNDERARILTTALRDAGLRTVAWTDAALLHDENALRARLYDRNPRVIMCDLEPPFDTQLALFRLIRSSDMRRRHVVVTTVAPAAIARERRRLGIRRVVGLPATVETIIAVLAKEASTVNVDESPKPVRAICRRSRPVTVSRRAGPHETDGEGAAQAGAP